MMNQDYLGFLAAALGLRLFSVGTTSVTVGALLLAIIFIVGIWSFASLLERSLHRLTQRYEDEPWKFARIHMLSRLLRYSVWVFGTIIGMNYLGIDLTSIALLGSALAVGLGFGLQNVFSNFVSGVIILLERSLKVGDFVELESGVRGHVREIAMRYTRVSSNDSLDVLVPNSEFINGRVVNWTLDDSYRRMHIPFGVAYGTAKELVREAGIAAALKVPGVVHHKEMQTAVWLVAYGDSSVNYELIVWADRDLTTRPASTHAKLMWALDDELAARKIEIPFPQRNLHVRSGTLNVRMDTSAPQTNPTSAPPGETQA
ncbi:mechanosensitive ion channel family protein [Rhodoferax sp. PAMC 29310]|uniref:mechanosensitive ion channel family protein n=1 Tax=Rhodoferax sp. PAMC 29310 TaxID=2822760 RepID=UPI001B32C795|nr:mechanosensitive ion channel domain-containing protein [Rhodoferax sp. PAMC 29310]